MDAAIAVTSVPIVERMAGDKSGESISLTKPLIADARSGPGRLSSLIQGTRTSTAAET